MLPDEALQLTARCVCFRSHTRFSPGHVCCLDSRQMTGNADREETTHYTRNVV